MYFTYYWGLGNYCRSCLNVSPWLSPSNNGNVHVRYFATRTSSAGKVVAPNPYKQTLHLRLVVHTSRVQVDPKYSDQQTLNFSSKTNARHVREIAEAFAQSSLGDARTA